MRIRIYEKPVGHKGEYGDWIEWEVSYDEYLAETVDKIDSGFETFTWMTWDYDMTARPFVWIKENDREAIFVGMFFFRKRDEDAMKVFIMAKYPEAESVEFLDGTNHFWRMYGFYENEEFQIGYHNENHRNTDHSK